MLVPPVGAAYYRLVFPSFVGVYLLVLYSARNWYTSQEKQPGYTLYSLLGQEYSFSCYYKQFCGLNPLEPHKGSAPNPKLQL